MREKIKKGRKGSHWGGGHCLRPKCVALAVTVGDGEGKSRFHTMLRGGTRKKVRGPGLTQTLATRKGGPVEKQ